MKNCPYCKAEIEDGARFCLYCMKPLQEKAAAPDLSVGKRRWWIGAIVLILAAVIVLLIFLPRGEETPDAPIPPAETTLMPSEPEETTTLPSDPEDVPVITPPDDPAEPSQDPVTPIVPEETTPEETTPEETTPEETTPEETTPEETTPEETIPEETTPEETSPEETDPVPEPEATYLYRLAQAGDDFSAHYANTGNDIVITGVETAAEDGVYEIPAYIDGKRVIAIMGGAFSTTGSNAKTVYLPETVRNVWTNAFANCPLEHIYFTENTYMPPDALPESAGILTIHCPFDCQDRNYRYYRSAAEYWYDARYEEWNG